MKKPNMIAIEIMAGKTKDNSYSKEGMEPHMATCPKCGHEFSMGEMPEEAEEEEED